MADVNESDAISSSDVTSEVLNALTGHNTPLPAPSEIPSDDDRHLQTSHHHHHFPENQKQVHHFYYKDRIEHHAHDSDGNVRVTHTSCTGKRPKLAGSSSQEVGEQLEDLESAQASCTVKIDISDMEIQCVYQLSPSEPSGSPGDRVHLFETCVHGARRVLVCAECLGKKRKMRKQ